MQQKLAMDKIKSLAIAKLKNGESHDKIGADLEISPAIIGEWAEQLQPSEMIAKEVNAIAIQKAQELLTIQNNNNTEQLQHTLLNLALAITDEVKIGLHDQEIAKAINTSADTISKLQNAFFAKSTQIAVINNPTQAAQASEELNIFRGALRS